MELMDVIKIIDQALYQTLDVVSHTYTEHADRVFGVFVYDLYRSGKKKEAVECFTQYASRLESPKIRETRGFFSGILHKASLEEGGFAVLDDMLADMAKAFGGVMFLGAMHRDIVNAFIGFFDQKIEKNRLNAVLRYIIHLFAENKRIRDERINNFINRVINLVKGMSKSEWYWAVSNAFADMRGMKLDETEPLYVYNGLVSDYTREAASVVALFQRKTKMGNIIDAYLESEYRNLKFLYYLRPKGILRAARIAFPGVTFTSIRFAGEKSMRSISNAERKRFYDNPCRVLTKAAGKAVIEIDGKRYVISIKDDTLQIQSVKNKSLVDPDAILVDCLM